MAGVMLLCIEGDIDDCVKVDGRIGATFTGYVLIRLSLCPLSKQDAG